MNMSGYGVGQKFTCLKNYEEDLEQFCWIQGQVYEIVRLPTRTHPFYVVTAEDEYVEEGLKNGNIEEELKAGFTSVNPDWNASSWLSAHQMPRSSQKIRDVALEWARALGLDLRTK